MPAPLCAILPERACIRLSGDGAAAFLNALLTCDVGRLATERAVHAGLLTPKGKLSFEFLLAAAGDAILIDCDAARRDALMAKLRLYRMRARIDIEAQPQETVVLWHESAAAAPALPAPQDATLFADPRLAALGLRILPDGPAHAWLQRLPEARRADADAYRSHRLRLGVAEGAAELPADRFFPWEANLDLLNAISLDKGCFIGQEIVSRVYRKGRVSRRLLPLRLAEDDAPRPGDPIRLRDKTVGALHLRHGACGLALMQMDAIAAIAADPAALAAGATPARLLLPSWLQAESAAWSAR